MVRNDFKHVILIENSENRGFAAANNQAIAVAKGRYVLLLNSDTIVLDKAVEKTIAFADENPKAGAIGCRVLNPDETLQKTCFMFPSVLNMLLSSVYLYKIFPTNKFFGREQMTWWDRDDVREVDVITGCFMLVRREAIEQVGVLDEQYFMYGEETDWCFRLKKNGWKVIFAPVGRIIHFGGQSSRKIRSDMLVQCRVSILHFMKKHYNWLVYRIACIFTLFFFLYRLPVWIFIVIFNRKNRTEARNKIKAYTKGIGKVLIRLCTL
jgi:GT2 family glycosyltransferase